jgi:hypothetical protein
MTMYDHWREIVYDAVDAKGGIVRMGPSIFNKHMSILRERYEVTAIRDGFRRFAALVESGKVDVRGKSAWFVFFGRYERFIPQFKPAESIADVERKPVKTLADFKPQTGRNVLAPP